MLNLSRSIMKKILKAGILSVLLSCATTQEEFISFVEKNNLPGVKEAIQDKNHPDGTATFFPLIFASQRGYIEIVKFLIQNKANINKQDLNGNTALHAAIINRNKSTVSLLLENGADFNLKNFQGETLLISSIRSDESIFRVLAGYSVNFNEKNAQGNTPLMVATEEGQADTVSFLVEKKVDINSQNEEGMTALMFASSLNRVEIAKMLIQNRADLSKKDNEGNTAIMHASRNGSIDVMKILIENGTIKLEQRKDFITVLENFLIRRAR